MLGWRAIPSRLIEKGSAVVVFRVVALCGACGLLEASVAFAFYYAPWQARNAWALPALLLSGVLSYGAVGLAAGVAGALARSMLMLVNRDLDPARFAAAWSAFALSAVISVRAHRLGPMKTLPLDHPVSVLVSAALLAAAVAATRIVYRRLTPWRSGWSPFLRLVGILIVVGEARAVLGTPAPVVDPASAALAQGLFSAEKIPVPVKTAAQLPNVLLISVDTLRADHLNAWGYRERRVSPNIDRLAQEGVRFQHAYAPAPWTRPSMASLLTSLYPRQHGQELTSTLKAEVVTLPEVLRAMGYHTAYFCANPVMAFDPALEYEEAYLDYPPEDPYYVSPILSPKSLVSPLLGQVFKGLGLTIHRPAAHRYFVDAGRINAAVLRWLPKARSPFFLHIHYMEPHRPYFEHPYSAVQWDYDASWNRGRLLRRYDGEIQYLDQKLGELLSELERRGMARNLLVALTADHGEEFLEHGDWEHSKTLYREVLEIPLILRWPERLPSNRVLDDPVELVDVPATLVDLLAAARPQQWAGHSLVPLIKGQLLPPKPVLGHLVLRDLLLRPIGTLDSILDGDMKLLVHRRPGQTNDYRLFDLARDPGEQTDLSIREAQLVKKLEAQLDARLAAIAADTPPAANERALTPEEKDTLRALGYIG